MIGSCRQKRKTHIFPENRKIIFTNNRSSSRVGRSVVGIHGVQHNRCTHAYSADREVGRPGSTEVGTICYANSPSHPVGRWFLSWTLDVEEVKKIKYSIYFCLLYAVRTIMSTHPGAPHRQLIFQ